MQKSSEEMFLIRALEKITSEKDIKKSQHTQLRQACETALLDLKKNNIVTANDKQIEITDGENAKPSTVLPPLKSEHGILLADQTYLLPFELACKSKSPKIVISALDCLQKLIAYGHVPNEMRDSSGEKRLIERIVEVICSCFQGVQTDEGIQLQVIKALLTVMTSPLVEIHEGDVLSVVRTCYNIYLASRSAINQTTARGTLTQMLNVIFQRMEQQTLDEAATHTNQMAPTQPTVIHPIEEESTEEIEKAKQSPPSDETDGEVVADIVEHLVLRVEKLSLSISTSELASGMDQSSESHTPVSVDQADSNSLGENSGHNSLGVFAHISQKDAFLVFRSLCRLSMKPLPDGAPDPKSHELRSKVLSLQLLLSILQNPGPVFKQSEMFITAIKQYLCVALSKNGVSSVPEVFELSLAIFLSLLSSFKQHLKMQIEVFFKEIFLYILETPSSSFEHKSNVIEALKRICSDAQCVVDIYLNYDCDFSLSNIFERLVTDLAKIAQGRQALELTAAPIQIRSLRQRGLECLVLILKCMAEWSSELYVNPDVSANLGAEQHRGAAAKAKQDSGYAEGTGSLASRSSSQNSLVGSQTPLAVNSQLTYPEILDNPEQFESKKQLKEIFESGIALFAKKPIKGVRFLQTHNLIGKSAEDVGEFLHKEDRLDRNAIGEFLGENDKFHIEVMYAYIDQLDFAKSEFVSALRTFLAGFRLPGEAQKIDRLMEKFASRYCECNPGNELFASADTAYVLAFSIIMLTTDLHSSQIKQNHRMTKEEYIRMNRGINDRDDLPEAYLAKIYDEIAGNEIKIKETVTRKPPPTKQSSSTSEKERKILFFKEMEQTAEAAKSLMESVSTIQSEFTSATHYDHVRPMFKIVWTPFLAAFSVGLQDCDDTEISQYCLEGVRYAIRISCIFHMELERDAYVQALCRFTLLTATAQLTEMKTKNVETIKTLVTLAHTDGNYLGRSWLDVLRCISQLESAQLIGSTTHTQKRMPGPHETVGQLTKHFLTNNSTGHTRDSRSGSILAGSSSISEIHPEDFRKIAVLQEAMGETGSQSLVVAVDKIFTASYKLDGEAIVDFVRALCQVSREELSLGQPRMFSLQKVVEISYYNMGRIRLQWSRIWEILGDHFNSAGRSTNEDVSVFAVDSLRQLSMKFIEKGEFPNFHFQKEFLRPFLSILEDRPNLTVKIQDMVVRCISQMVNTHWANIRSGWTNIFGVFHKVASYDEESIVEIAFQTSAFVVQEVFKTHFQIVVDSFQGLVKALAEFACNTHFPDISMEAIRLIRTCAHYVAERAQNFRDFQDTESAVTEDDRVWVKGWMPVLCELFRVIHSCKLDVRTRGLTVFFEIIKTYGGQFKPRWWQETFNVIFRVFLHMRNDQSENSSGPSAPPMTEKGPSDRTEWMTTTCNHTLYAIVDVFTQYYDVLYDVLLEDLYAQLRWCCLQEHEQLARSGTSCLENVINCNGHRFTSEIWHRTVTLLVDIFASSVPHKLLTWKPSQLDSRENSETNLAADSSRPPSRHPSSGSISSMTKSKSLRESHAQIFAGLLIKCVVQFELIQTIDHIVFYPATSKKEDQENWRRAGLLINNSPDFSAPLPADFVSEKEMSTSTERKSEPELNNHISTDSPRESCGDMVGPSLTSYTNSLSEDCADVFHHQGLYRYLAPEQLMALIECLLQSHRFAKEFNSNHEQRNLLWKAGFKGKAKPNLLKQETQSLACALRILFKLSVDPRLNEDKDMRLKLESLLISVCTDALVYFKHVSAESHREAWSSVIILLLTRLIFLPGADSRFKLYATSLYHHLVDLIIISPLPTEIRALIRGFFIRCGRTFNVVSIEESALSTNSNENCSNHSNEQDAS